MNFYTGFICCLVLIVGNCKNHTINDLKTNKIESIADNYIKANEIKIDKKITQNDAVNFIEKNPHKKDSVNSQIYLLRNYFLKYNEIEKKGGFVAIPPIKKTISIRDTAFSVKYIKKYLFQTGDITIKDTGNVFDSMLLSGIKSIQYRFGLIQTGKITKSLIAEMNVPIKRRLHQININIERYNKFNRENIADYVLVNIPEYKLHLVENNHELWSMDIIVGKIKNPTAIFDNKIQYVVFSPYWNVPNSILNNELIPLIKKNKFYITKHNMEWVGGKLRQRPGPDNPLGLIKFLFPNRYNIYLHDTPVKSLFKQEKRIFSHGCIRIAEAQKLAEYLLRNDTSWTIQKIKDAMNAKEERFVKIKVPFMVFIDYFTSWVDMNGLLHFRKDIYKKDQ